MQKKGNFLKEKLLFTLGAILFVFLISFTYAYSNVVELTSCGNLDSEDTEYVLVGNIITNDDCFEVTADNVMLNGNGSLVVGDGYGRGIEAMDVEDLKIFNLILKDFSQGVFFDDVYNSELKNLTVKNTKIGAKIRASEAITISGSNFDNNGDSLNIVTTKKSVIRNNIINNTESDAIQLAVSYDNIIESNVISNSNVAVYLGKGSNKNLIAENEFYENNNAFLIRESMWNKVYNSNIEGDQKLEVSDSSTNNFFVNVSYDNSLEDIEAGSKLLRKGYLSVKVAFNDSKVYYNASSNITETLSELFFLDGANVAGYDLDGHLKFSEITNENGSIEAQELLEYANNGRRRIYYNDYVVKANRLPYQFDSINFQLSGNADLLFVTNRISYEDPTSKIVITNVSLNPGFPMTNNGSEQSINIAFKSDTKPLNISFLLWKHNSDFFLVQDSSIIEDEDVNLVYVLPSNLTEGIYTLNMTLKDRRGNSRVVAFGPINVEIANETGQEQPIVTPTPSGGGGGGGGGGSSGSSLSDIGGLTNISNITSPFEEGGLSPINLTVPETNETETGFSISKITGAVVGAFKSSPGKVAVLLFLMLLLIIAIIVSSKTETSSKKNGNGKREKEKS